MSKRSADEITKFLEDQQDAIAELIRAGRTKEASDIIVAYSKTARQGIFDLEYQGKKVGDIQEFKNARVLTDRMFKRIWDCYWNAAPFPLQDLMMFNDTNFMIVLYQGFDVVGVFNQISATLDPRLRSWIMLSFYPYLYEITGKLILAYTNVLKVDGTIDAIGQALKTLSERYHLAELDDCFDYFLRNAIDHSQFIIKKLDAGLIEAWNVEGARPGPKRQYEIASIFTMTTKMIFFLLAYHVSWYETVVELDRRQGLLDPKGAR
jgi:hypothetical protein